MTQPTPLNPTPFRSFYQTMETSASEIQINGVKYIRADSVPAVKANGNRAVPVPDNAPLPLLPEDAQMIEPTERTILVPAPVPVSERLPGDQLCWWFEADEDCGYGSNWTLLRIRGSATGYTHWLPHHALPVPTTRREEN